MPSVCPDSEIKATSGHEPVLKREAIELLAPRDGQVYLDCTFGGGGHSRAILESANCKLVAIDRDADAKLRARTLEEQFPGRFEFASLNFSKLKELKTRGYAGILMDLGVSSFQLDEGERGFSYRTEAPLDMRMDRRQSLSAYEVVNEYSEQDLYHIIRDLGEDRFAKNIAKHIVTERAKEPIRTTTQLAEIIKQAIPARMREGGGHPAKRTFQAIRIEVNRELDILTQSLEPLIDVLAPHGRLCIISFHSLEDRAVKNAFRKAQDPCICPKDLPVCVCGRKPKGRVVTRKPIISGEEELQENNRAHSAKLRIFEAVG